MDRVALSRHDARNVKIISIHSYRGGTGKSNLTANIAWWMARRGKRVGVIDTDLQSPGVHMVFEFDTQRITFTLTDFLFGKCEVHETVYDLSVALGLVILSPPVSPRAGSDRRVHSPHPVLPAVVDE